MDVNFEREYDINFVGREAELRWLDEHLFRNYSISPIVISGPAGVGKTSLLKQWFASRRIAYIPLWPDLLSETDDKALDNLIHQIHNQRENYRYERGITVVIDGTDIWSQEKHEEAANKIFNYKAVSSLVFITLAI